MIRFSFYSAILSLFIVSCATQKTVVEEADAPTMSKSEYPYIEHFHKGLRYMTTNRIEEAINELEACLIIRQDDDAVYYALSKLELQKGNSARSSEYIEKAAEIDPENTWYIQEKAYMYYELGDFEKSAENFEKLVAIEPKNVDWIYGYAEALTNAGEFDKAISAMNETQALLGKHPDFYIKRHRLYLQSNQKTKAEEELIDGNKEFPDDGQIIALLVDFYFKNNDIDKATVMLEELVRTDNSNGRAHLALADIYRQKGDMKRAYVELEHAYQSDQIDLETKIGILQSVNESSATIDDEIYGLVDILSEKYPDDANVNSLVGDFMLRKGDEDKALVAYKKALETDKSLYPIWNQVLIMEFERRDYENLYKDSKECKEYFPSVALVYLLHGIASNQLNKYDEALETLSLGVEFVVNDNPVKAEFYGQIGEANFGLHVFPEAIKSYKKAMDLVPDSRLIKNNFALRLADYKMELDLAESLLKQVVKEAPDRPEYIDNYGWVLFQKGKYAEALIQYDDAIKLSPNDVLIMEHIGDALIQLGKVNSALDWWNKSLSMQEENTILEQKISEKKYYEPNN